jgi:8-oxo-dGTP diphosphatase
MPAVRAVRAAGGVIWRPASSESTPLAPPEVLVVHRPAYDDWTFPKGKVEAGESDEECARREVAEETGLVCALGEELASVDYVDRHGRPKVVRYWAMQPEPLSPPAWSDPAVDTGDEVDELRWVSSETAGELLTYQRDTGVLASFQSSRRGGSGPARLQA